MATTTNYGWTTPDDTALVKDGAAAIRTLGSSIDTSLNTALGTKKAGMVLLNTTSFSAVASQALNNVFTSTYTNYLILIDLIPVTGAELRLKLRAAGSDTSTGYNRQVLIADNTTASAGRSTNQSDYDLFATTTGQRTAIEILLYRPNVAGTTGGIVKVSKAYDSSSPVLGVKTFGQTASTQFDGFNIIASSSTITGKVSVYGFSE
jgi:hypothetical protein